MRSKTAKGNLCIALTPIQSTAARLVFTFVVGIGCAIALYGQSNTAIISGTVTDASGAVVAGAKVDVKNVGTQITQSTTSNAQGRYRVPELLIGDYEVQVTQTGFQTVVRKGITVTVGSESDHRCVAASRPIAANRDGRGAGFASRYDFCCDCHAGGADADDQDLPLNGRNFESLIALAPGVITIPNTGGPFYGKNDNYSIAGSRPLGQQILIDDTNFMGFWGHATGSGAAGSSLGLEAIAEFQTLTNTYTAQFGGNGGVVNASSKSGTNSFHGSAYEFLRNSAMDSRSPFDSVVLPGNTAAQRTGFPQESIRRQPGRPDQEGQGVLLREL